MRTPQNSVCGGTSPFLLTSDVGSDDHDSRLAIADLIIFPSPPLRDPKMSLSHMQAYDDGEWWQALICLFDELSDTLILTLDYLEFSHEQQLLEYFKVVQRKQLITKIQRYSIRFVKTYIGHLSLHQLHLPPL
ncbi:hypothetical protein HanIR_Chr12g0574501 [Helianthus annuus]|nr:hypothetical protein HanIR_Chr12g0574501 [Helianthus annuus]